MAETEETPQNDEPKDQIDTNKIMNAAQATLSFIETLGLTDGERKKVLFVVYYLRDGIFA